MSTRRTRDEAYQKTLTRYGITESPVLNAGDSEQAPPVEDIEKYKKQDRKIVFTVDQAVEYVQLPVFAGERAVADRWAQYLLDEMVRGNFNWDLVHMARCECNGVTYKINGQHTSWARVAAPLAKDPTVRELLYRVDSEEQLRQIYRTFDRAKSRGDAHLMHVEILGQHFDPAIRQSWATAVAAGVKFWQFERTDAYRKVREEQMAAILAAPNMRSLFERACLFCQELSRADKAIKRQPVLAAIVATFSADADAAAEFWTDIADGTNLTRNDARWMLHNYLNRSVLQLKSKVGNGRQTVSSEDMYRVSVNLWNKWRAGESVSAIRIPGSRPKPI